MSIAGPGASSGHVRALPLAGAGSLLPHACVPGGEAQGSQGSASRSRDFAALFPQPAVHAPASQSRAG